MSIKCDKCKYYKPYKGVDCGHPKIPTRYEFVDNRYNCKYYERDGLYTFHVILWLGLILLLFLNMFGIIK